MVCAAALATLEAMANEGLLANAERMGELIRGALREALAGVAGLASIRGMGLMIGVELDRPCGELVKRALDAGMLINVTADKVVRLLPPLVIGEHEARELAARLAALIRGFLEQPAA
jgi:acetylornithine aminotransferase